jgi:hypothetical protein
MLSIDSKELVKTLELVLDNYKLKGTEINEIGDLANEIGIILGEKCTDKKELINQFISGFKHGVNNT